MRKKWFVGRLPIAVTSYIPAKTSKAPLVFIHMSWGGAWVFKFYIKFFASEGYPCYAVDLRGHGKSGGTVEGAAMADYVNDVRAAITELSIKNPIIIGHSMGGLIALMYGAEYESAGVVSLDGSPPAEVQKTSQEIKYPRSYKPEDAGMPKNPLKAMRAFFDISPMRLMLMKLKLGVESGVARSERKKGVSVPREKLIQPLLFIGAEHGSSVPFGIDIEIARAQADYYNAPVVEIKNASHPGLLIGRYWKEAARAILVWLKNNQ